MNMAFWFRWSMRDLRARWIQILATAVIVALGTATYAGLSGQQRWRESSYDASFAQLYMFDLQLSFTDGNYVEAASVASLLDGIDGVRAYESRLIVPTLVETQADGKSTFVQGELVGIDTIAPQPHINDIFTSEGRGFEATDTGENVAIVDEHFVLAYDLSAGDTLRISGGNALSIIGVGLSPEYFQVIAPNGIASNNGEYAVVFMPLASVQQVAGKAERVNDVILLLEDGVSVEAVQAQLDAALVNQSIFSGMSYQFTQKQDQEVYKLLYTDAKNDQGMMTLLAILFLLGSAMTAFNLASRMVQSQRRQIGIGMALGIEPKWLAIRPLMFGIQIAILGAVLGVAMGYGLNSLFASFFKTVILIPTWTNAFHLSDYVVGIIFGVAVPLVATVVPAWRAVRVEPLQAIQTGTLAPSNAVVSGVQNIPLPGRSFVKVPVRNLLRTPWRTVLTLLGIAIGIILLTAMLGILDTFRATAKQMETAYLHEHDNRMLIYLDGFYPQNSETVQGVSQLQTPDGGPLLQDVQTSLVLDASLRAGEIENETTIELVDMQNMVWTPSLLDGQLPSAGNDIMISEKMARDLNIKVGDTVTLVHPVRQDAYTFTMQETDLHISGIHDNPLRGLGYMSPAAAATFNMEGLTNYLVVVPADGVDEGMVQQAIFSLPNVAAIQAVKELSDAFNNAVDILGQVLQLTGVIVVVLSFLVAFNVTTINLDERVREVATMFAFGLRVRTVLRMQILENMVIGLLGTLVGVGVGYLLLQSLFQTQIEEQFPDVQFQVVVGNSTLLVAALIGVLVVGLTPLFTIRRILRMNIPDMLRVME